MDLFDSNGSFKGKRKPAKTSLADDFNIMSSNILDTRRSEWRNRVNAWKSFGIDSGQGRANNLAYGDGLNNEHFSGTSIFDPALTELMYQWFCPKGGSVLDPFAGGSVRGIVAGAKGHHYTGIDLRPEQIKANYINLNQVNVDKSMVDWKVDDALNINNYVEDESQDMVIACPPYFDLEQYSDDPRDLSNMKYDDFGIAYSNIIRKCLNTMKPNRFAVFVVSNVRSQKNGMYRRLVDYTNQKMYQHGAVLYNEAILINALGTGQIRAARYMHNRKLVNQFQNVQIYYKGDTSKIKEEFHAD